MIVFASLALVGNDKREFLEGTMSTAPDLAETRVYSYAASRGEISSVITIAPELGLSVPAAVSAVTRLVELRLLRTDGERLLPVEPATAVATLVSPIERAIFQRRDAADRLLERIEAITDWAVDRAPVGAIDGLDGTAEIRGLIKLAADTCREELTVLRPGAGDEEDLLDEVLEPCYSVLDRDLAVRVICPHRSRAGFASRAIARRLTDRGAQIRTLSQVPQAAVVFDRTLAVLLSIPEQGGEPMARRVRDQKVIRFLLDLFGHLWATATPFLADEAGYADAVDDLQRSIVRLMAQGFTDEVVARRLGMSVRTCRRHIAALLQDLDSASRFQAGFQAASRLAASANGA